VLDPIVAGPGDRFLGKCGAELVDAFELELVLLEGIDQFAGSLLVVRRQGDPRSDEPAPQLTRRRLGDEAARFDHSPGVAGAAFVEEERGIYDAGFVVDC
jgi:hypothetical protein